MTTDLGAARRTLSWLVVVALAAQLLAAIRGWLLRPDSYVAGVVPAALVCIGMLVAWMAWRSASGLSVTPALRMLVVVSTLGVAAHRWGMADAAVDPPLLPLLITGACASVLVSVRTALLVVPTVAVAGALVRSSAVDPARAAGEAVLVVAAAFAVLASVQVVARALAAVPAAVVASRDAAEEQARIGDRARARQLWDGLVHDKVLGALSAPRAPGPLPAAARELAADALAFLRGGGRPEASLDARWRNHAARLGLEADIRVTGDLDGDADAAEALAGAVEEALTNVRRHSGQLAARVVADLTGGGAHVVVTDHGVGIGGADTAGLGVRLGIEARMRAVGGRAEIGPAVGCGTAVVLSWPGRARGGPGDRPLPPWPALRTLPTRATLLAVAILAPAVALAEADPQAWTVVVDAVVVTLAAVAAGRVVRTTLADAWEVVETMTQRAAELRLALAVEGDERRDTAERAAALDVAVGGALEVIRDAPGLDAEQVLLLRRLASTTRDRLAAADLVDAVLADALSDARERGARVDVVPGHPWEPLLAADVLGACRSLLATVLATIGQDAAVRVTWAGGGGVSTIAVAGSVARVADRLHDVVATAEDVLGVAIDDDEESVLVVLTPRVPPGQAVRPAARTGTSAGSAARRPPPP